MRKLKKREALHMLRLNKNTLVLRSRVFLKRDSWQEKKNA